jgi:hypothetical protein
VSTTLLVPLSLVVLLALLVVLVLVGLHLDSLLNGGEVFVVIFLLHFLDVSFLGLVFLLLIVLSLVGLDLILLLCLQGEVTYLANLIIFVEWLIELGIKTWPAVFGVWSESLRIESDAKII